ncbi:hypothetical protein BH11BAC1_BH11BAC1_18580 [soil metagenome]
MSMNLPWLWKNNFKLRSFIFRKRIRNMISLLVLISFLNLLFGCTYYKVSSFPPGADAIAQTKQPGKYIIVHNGSEAWHLKDITLNDEGKLVTGTKEILGKNHDYYLTANPYGVNRYHQSKGTPSYEVHIYTSEYAEDQNSRVTIPLSEISKIEVYDTAIGASVASYIFIATGIVAGVAVIVLIIALLTKSSCPFIYVNDGNSYRFTGELYGGAIYSSLERDDFMPIPLPSVDAGKYRFKISNELLERQYTNLAELQIISHPENVSVLIDKLGVINTIANPMEPIAAQSDLDSNHIASVLRRDSSSYLFGDESKANKELSSLELTFKKPLHSKSGKLLLNAKNSFWLDYIYGKFTEQFGTYYNQFAEKQKKVPAKRNIEWSLAQGIPLSVYVETINGWQFVDYFNVIGPLASRDLVMQVDLSKVSGEDVHVKLECGFMFWEIDYAAMDFSENIPVETQTLIPDSAVDEKGIDVAPLLEAIDNRYLIQPGAGNEAMLNYTLTQVKKGKVQSLFLHSRGYYEYIRNYKSKPDLLYLSSFKKKGAFTKFSKEHYYEFTGKKDFYSTALNTGNGN